mmetsp:Transcript_21160/g.54172  ORF Transcript_21160/g.54172 Transcript_21160/m.54172 type:complete len:408 (+) Transcript_21160:30-1253(+)|eukprot:CAMPEP_0115857814 /NCGR_PEP_ID=MMETSP0287-20121206/15772_1 /TAXON_ID=412157 /ORGANISM="Chrysochromulina rotalis, Strain UIO044" /LENGTH=407 /DNA_ID=CAMNT_0003312051 /DNA_START=23 /DNA_END=1246 /DNA_ORIENTATION=-
MAYQLLPYIATSALVLSTPRTPVKVWDGVLASSTLQTVIAAGEQRAHCFTTVFDRGDELDQVGRTAIEATLTSIVGELGDDCRYIEYWWRGESNGMEVHRDVDEAFCRSHQIDGVGLQRCPINGHVLYLDVGAGVRGPTCVWEEEEVCTDSGGPSPNEDVRAGAPRTLRTLHVVPAVPGRLLRFDGASLHSVMGPNCNLLESVEPHIGSVKVSQQRRRATLLFNTWRDPPGLPSPKDPAPAKAVAAFEKLETSPTCSPASAWRDTALEFVPMTIEGDEVTIQAPLLGDVTRRGCQAPSLTALVAADSLLPALESTTAVHSLELRAGEPTVVAPRTTGSKAAVVEVDEEEELAMRLGHAAHLESEFWGLDEDDEDDEELDEEGQEEQSDFWANVAAMQALEAQSREES